MANFSLPRVFYSKRNFVALVLSSNLSVAVNSKTDYAFVTREPILCVMFFFVVMAGYLWFAVFFISILLQKASDSSKVKSSNLHRHFPGRTTLNTNITSIKIQGCLIQ